MFNFLNNLRCEGMKVYSLKNTTITLVRASQKKGKSTEWLSHSSEMQH